MKKVSTNEILPNNFWVSGFRKRLFLKTYIKDIKSEFKEGKLDTDTFSKDLMLAKLSLTLAKYHK